MLNNTVNITIVIAISTNIKIRIRLFIVTPGVVLHSLQLIALPGIMNTPKSINFTLLIFSDFPR